MPLPRDGRLRRSHERGRPGRAGRLSAARGDLDPRHFEEALARATRAFVHALGGDAGLVLLSNRREDRFVARAPVGIDPGLLVRVAGGFGAWPDASSTRRALRSGQPVTSSARDDGPTAAPFAQAGYEGLVAVPLEVGGAFAGVVQVLARGRPLEVSPDEALARAAPLAPLAHALRAYELARATDARAEVVARVAQGVLSNVELAALFPELIRLVASLCPCDAASVAVQPEPGFFELAAVYGSGAPEAIRAGVRIPADETPIALAWKGELVYLPDQRQSVYPRARKIAEGGIVAAILLPVGTPTRGVLCVGHRVPYAFGDEEIELYRSIVPFIDIALRNAELVAKMRGAYRELEATQERLVRAERMRALGELAAGVAHDVGNVLALVASHAELVAQRTSDEDMKRLLGQCRRSVADGVASVRRMMTLARDPEAPRDPSSRVRLDDVVREALALAAARTRGHAVDPSLHEVPEVAGAPGEVRDVVLNLLLNALDATPPEGRIAVATRHEASHVTLTVEDSGAGVPEERRERVFEPFFTTKGHAHAGLGLSRVARFARLAGGSVRVDRSPALGGARFELRLPPAESAVAGRADDREPARDRSRRRAVSVLLVEDEPALRNALGELLRLRGHEVVTAGDVTGGIEALELHPGVEVLVTDLGLPDRSGWELVDAVKRRSPDLPVIVLSGWAALTDMNVARDRGVSAVLPKPTSDADLAATIEAVVGG